MLATCILGEGKGNDLANISAAREQAKPKPTQQESTLASLSRYFTIG